MRFFISSTYTDLIQFRKFTIQYFKDLTRDKTGDTAAMEFFDASESTCKEECLRNLASSDIVIGIYGSRYGSIDDETNLSMTEVEFDYAVKHGKPILGFVTRDSLEEKQEKFIHGKVFKRNKSCARFSTLVEYADRLYETLKSYLNGFEGFSYDSLWGDVKELRDQVNEEIERGAWRMKVYTDEDRDDVLQSMSEDINYLLDLLPSTHNFVNEIAGFGNYGLEPGEIQKMAKNKWTYYFIGLPNVLQRLKLKISFLQLLNLQHRLLTEPWTEELRQLVIEARDSYIDTAEKSYYID